MPIRHVVRQGDCLASLSDQYGFADWKTIWNHPDNAALKQKRKKPGVLFQGDVVTIPDRERKDVDCATGQMHRFKVRRPKTTVRIAIKVHGSFKYELRIGSATFSGSVPDGAPIEHPIEPSASSGELDLWPDKGGDGGEEDAREGLVTYPILLGHLDPVDEIAGVQGVLTNLGYYWGSLDGVLGPDTVVAIQAFQRANGMDATGAVDDALKSKLKELHDG